MLLLSVCVRPVLVGVGVTLLSLTTIHHITSTPTTAFAGIQHNLCLCE
jgi:hypothetical protein